MSYKSIVLVGILMLGCGSSGSGSGSGAGGSGAGGGGGEGVRTGGGGEGATGPLTCDFTPCGGDPTGTWKLYTFCAPDYVSGYAEYVTFTADGKYGYTSSASGNTYSGTYTTSGTKITITVTQSSTEDYCVKGDVMWWGGGSQTVVRTLDPR